MSLKVFRERGRRLCRMIALPLLSVTIILVGMIVGLRLAGPVAYTTPLGDVSYEVRPAIDGKVTAYVPVADWGFSVDAYTAPFDLDVELRRADREQLLAAASGERKILLDAENELANRAETAVLRAWVVGLGVVALLCSGLVVLWPWARARATVLALWVLGASVAASLVVLSLAFSTFEPTSFRSPTYFARGEELTKILATAEREATRGGYSGNFEQSLRSFSSLISEGVADPAPSDGRSLIVASDLHNNALVLDPLRRISSGRPALLVGDYGQRGSDIESALLAEKIAAIGSPAIAVSGNHDSDYLMRALEGAGAKVLDAERPYWELGDVLIAGWPDPLEHKGDDPHQPGRVFTFAEDESGVYLRKAKQDVVAWFDALPRRPDIVMIHQSALSEHLAEVLWARGYSEPLVIVTGHDHRQRVERYGPINIVDGGTAGASGLYGYGTDYAGIAQLHLDPDGALTSVDLIRAEPVSGRAEAERVVVDSICDEDEDDRCSFEPGD